MNQKLSNLNGSWLPLTQATPSESWFPCSSNRCHIPKSQKTRWDQQSESILSTGKGFWIQVEAVWQKGSNLGFAFCLMSVLHPHHTYWLNSFDPEILQLKMGLSTLPGPVVIPFFRGSSGYKNWIWVSWIASRFFTTREARHMSEVSRILST